MEGIEHVIEVARRGVLHSIDTPEGKRHCLVVDGKVHELSPTTPLIPTRVLQAVRIDTKDSFVEYVSAFKRPASRIFADIVAGSFVAALDYHNPGGGADGVNHRATFKLQLSEQWTRWTGISGKLMDQAEFVRFLEENCADIAVPSAAELMEICRDFSAKRKVDFRNVVRLDNGARQFEFSEDVKGVTRNGEIEVPSKFVLEIPIYYGEPSLSVHAFLRWRLDCALALGIELHRPTFVRQAAFEAIGRDIAEATATALHYGAI